MSLLELHIPIDLKTLILAIGIIHILQFILFFHQYRTVKAFSGVGWWLLWCGTEIIGFSCMLLRDIPAIFRFTVAIQNTSVIGGTIFICIGVAHFFGQKENLRLLLAGFILFIISFNYYLFINDDYIMRGVAISFALSYNAIYTAVMLLQNRRSPIAAAVIFNVFFFILHAIVFLHRGITLLTTSNDTNFYSATLFNLLPYIDALIVGITWTFGFILMINQRLFIEMKEAKEEAELIFKTSPDSTVITKSPEGTIVAVNPAFCTVTGYSEEEVLGKSVIDLNIWKSREERAILHDLINKKNYCENFEAEFVRKDGSEIIGLMSARSLTLQGIPHLLSITRDITERRRDEERIREYSKELELSNEAKDKLFSIVAHDLRNPVHVLLAASELLAEDIENLSPEEIALHSRELHKNLLKLYELLDALLTWALIQRKKIQFNPSVFQLHEKTDQVISLINELARSKSINITNSVDRDFNVWADEYMFNMIMHNLITNAIKFSHRKGRVEISAMETESEIQVSVKDNGVGMDQRKIEQLFRIELKNSSPGTANEKGSGLGLGICKELVELHGGKIWVVSQSGKGSEFVFSLKKHI